MKTTSNTTVLYKRTQRRRSLTGEDTAGKAEDVRLNTTDTKRSRTQKYKYIQYELSSVGDKPAGYGHDVAPRTSNATHRSDCFVATAVVPAAGRGREVAWHGGAPLNKTRQTSRRIAKRACVIAFMVFARFRTSVPGGRPPYPVSLSSRMTPAHLSAFVPYPNPTSS